MPGAEASPQTLYDKVLQAHVVDEKLDGTILLYIGWSLLAKQSHVNRSTSSYISPQQIDISYMKSHHR
jgi:hypothetical protein